jgi:hypothetical protein
MSYDLYLYRWRQGRRGDAMRIVFLLLVLLCAFPATAQEWSAGPVPGDPDNARVAWTRNADGHVLALHGEDDGDQYWLFVELRLGGGEALGGDIPSEEFRAGYPIENAWQLDYEKYGKTWGHIGKDRASWMIVASTKEDFAKTNVLKSWLSGSDVAIIYVTDAGVEKTTRFRLAGLKTALAEATGWKLEK